MGGRKGTQAGEGEELGGGRIQKSVGQQHLPLRIRWMACDLNRRPRASRFDHSVLSSAFSCMFARPFKCDWQIHACICTIHSVRGFLPMFAVYVPRITANTPNVCILPCPASFSSRCALAEVAIEFAIPRLVFSSSAMPHALTIVNQMDAKNRG